MNLPRLIGGAAFVLCCGFLLGAGAGSEPPAEPATEASPERSGEATPSVLDPLPLDHAGHSKAFSRAGLSCPDCHPVGLTSESTEVEMPPPPRSVCHACHRGEVQGAPRRASDRCAACHPVREELRPESHNLGWSEEHGPEAQALRNGCDTCHDRGQCIDCHESRGAMTRSPHGPGFRSFHGVDARADGASCVRCHAAETCLQCHQGGKRPW